MYSGRICSSSLCSLLSQDRLVLGWDPAFRTGCKLAVVDPTGKVIGTTVIYPTAPTTPQKIKASKDLLKKDHSEISYFSDLSRKRNRVEGVGAVYRGTVKRDTGEGSVCTLSMRRAHQYTRQASLPARSSPSLTWVRESAASIARRLQDPLAELVKIDPKSIGVGQYQHDMNQKKSWESP